MLRLVLAVLVGGWALSAAAAPRPMARPAQRSVALTGARSPSVPRTVSPLAPKPTTRVQTRVPGLFAAIDARVNHAPAAWGPGWTVRDEVEGPIRDPKHPHAGAFSVQTELALAPGTGSHGGGTMRVYYHPERGELVLYDVGLANLPGFVPSTVPLVEGRGTPLVTYLGLRQLRLVQEKARAQVGELEAALATERGLSLRRARLALELRAARRLAERLTHDESPPLSRFKIIKVVNPETMMEITAARRDALRAGLSGKAFEAAVDRAAASSSTVRYVEAIVQQSGHAIAAVHLKGGGELTLDTWLAEAERRFNAHLAPDPAIAARQAATMARLGFTPADRVTGFFSIELELRPL